MSKLKTPILILVFFYFYGVLYPVINGYSTLFYSLKSSKEFLMIFIYFSIILSIRSQKDIDKCWKIILFFGLYYSALELFVQVGRGSFVKYLVYDSRPEDFIFIKIYPPFWPFIMVALFYYSYSLLLKVSRQRLLFILSFLGLGLTFFRSYLLAFLFAVPAVMVLSGRKISSLVVGGVGAAFLLFIVIIVFSYLSPNSKIDLIDKMLLSGVQEITSQSGGALKGREVFTKQRLEILEDNPIFGFGFIDKESSFGLNARKHIYGDLLGFVDNGSVDVRMKFGWLGMIILYLNFIFMIGILIKQVKNIRAEKLQVRLLASASLILVYLIVQPVHAPLSNSFGIIPLFIILALVQREYLLVKQDELSIND